MLRFQPMFYARYLRSELLRRRGRTILTLLGLAVGVALVVAISSLSRGLDRAQKRALHPLASIGTDLTVTRSPQQDAGGFGGGGGEILAANRSVLTDLSKLGKPGQHFVHDFFLPGTQLTFPEQQTKQIASLGGVAAVANGLTLTAVHQQGTVPKIVAQLKTGGQTFRIRRRLPQLTAAELAKMTACFARLRAQQPQQQQGAGGFGGGGGGGRGGFGRFRQCLPARMREFRGSFTTPRQTLRQVLNPPQTNITSTTYTIGGVDQTQPGIGLVTPAQVTKGRFLSASGAREALLSATYAARNKLHVGSSLELNGTTFRVVGLVDPPLGGQSADVYLPLARLQTLSSQKGLANVALVRAASSSDVSKVSREIAAALPGAQVANQKQVVSSITGSLVSASNLSHDLGLVLEIVVAAAAFLLAALLALASVGKRVRELGTLKAIGWTQRQVVRQVVGESLATGVAGGVVGIGVGVAAAAAVDAFGPTLTAHSTTGGGSGLLGLGNALARTATTTVGLSAPLPASLLLVGFGLALLGGLLAGTAAALRAARLRPADALRTVE
jgi:putative ABC transport system permease protein